MKMSYERTDTGYYLSKHAVLQAQNRGVKMEIIDFVICHADIWFFVGDNRFSIRIGQRELNRLQIEGVPASLLEKSKNIVLIVSSSEPIIVTVIHDYGKKRGRCYRKQMPTKCKKRRQSQVGRSRACIPLSLIQQSSVG